MIKKKKNKLNLNNCTIEISISLSIYISLSMVMVGLGFMENFIGGGFRVSGERFTWQFVSGIIGSKGGGFYLVLGEYKNIIKCNGYLLWISKVMLVCFFFFFFFFFIKKKINK
jgi:hypothetical protein